MPLYRSTHPEYSMLGVIEAESLEDMANKLHQVFLERAMNVFRATQPVHEPDSWNHEKVYAWIEVHADEERRIFLESVTRIG